MRRFAILIEQLDSTNKTNHKVEALTNYFALEIRPGIQLEERIDHLLYSLEQSAAP